MNSTSTVDALFQGAVSDGLLSKGAFSAIDIRDIGAEINDALGVSVDDVKASEVTLVTLLIDDSGSIRFGGNAEAVRDGHNLVVEALKATKQKEGILVSCSYLNRGLLYPYMGVEQAPAMSSGNYDPTGGTPLYPQSLVTLATVLAKCQNFQDNGIPCRGVTAIVTDGGDTSGTDAGGVKKLVADLLKTENHIVAGVGVDDGTTDFKQVFKDMGIRDEWILTPKNSPSEIRKVFGMISQSAVRASQNAATFSQTAMGGFGAP
jgi:hypothetical protein